jgi:hypothetical protein
VKAVSWALSLSAEHSRDDSISDNSISVKIQPDQNDWFVHFVDHNFFHPLALIGMIMRLACFGKYSGESFCISRVAVVQKSTNWPMSPTFTGGLPYAIVVERFDADASYYPNVLLALDNPKPVRATICLTEMLDAMQPCSAEIPQRKSLSTRKYRLETSPQSPSVCIFIITPKTNQSIFIIVNVLGVACFTKASS